MIRYFDFWTAIDILALSNTFDISEDSSYFTACYNVKPDLLAWFQTPALRLF